ncbi:MAG: twin-arginine translocase subunit TatC [Pirellulales bacterium]|nr:twin-arginine translocase subunit TatC [Pirellulales bacterium]
MPVHHDESRLEQSKMSFGEHLEELRKALFKSIAALFLGFLVGLWFGNDIVRYIQTPVLQSLEQFYLRQTQTRQERHIEELKAQGKDASQEVITAEQLAAARLMLQEYLIDRDDLIALVKQAFPDAAIPESAIAPAESEAPAAESTKTPGVIDKPVEIDRSKLLTLRVFIPLEEDARLRVVGHETMEPFSIYIRTALVAGLVFASPFIFYFIWEFVAAGLYKQEQKLVYTFLPISLGLFIGGAFLAFFYAFEPLLDFMFWYYERMGIQPDLRLSDWISFVLLMPLAFGVSFQLPLIMVLLERIGIFTVDTYWRKWRAAIVVIAVIAMLLTPSADPYSMLLMGTPLVLLYFGGIWLCKILPGRSLAAAD